MAKNGRKALYPRCGQHLLEAGLNINEAAGLAKISASSVSRMKKQAPVLDTTVAKLIKSLNDHHFSSNGNRLIIENEMRYTD